MNRREFMAAAGAVSVGGFVGGTANGQGESPQVQYIEWWRYRLLPGRKRGRMIRFVSDALVPALNRLGIGPVGVFEPQYGEDSLTLRLLLPHRDLESVATVTDRLLEDDEFLRAGREILDAPMSDPAFDRLERTLMAAFRDFRKVAVPPQKEAGKPRVLELRIYESHSLKKGKKKVEMFNEGKEIPIFFKTGFHPVFFGETIAGPDLPNLQYMLAFDNLQERDEAWRRFGADPDWHKLRSDPQYAETVSRIHDLILRPVGASQI